MPCRRKAGHAWLGLALHVIERGRKASFRSAPLRSCALQVDLGGVSFYKKRPPLTLRHQNWPPREGGCNYTAAK